MISAIQTSFRRHQCLSCVLVWLSLVLAAQAQKVQEFPFESLKGRLVGHWRCVLEDIQCTGGRTPALDVQPFHLQQFHFRNDGTYSQSIHGALGLLRTESGSWRLEERGSADRKWHLLHLAPQRVWSEGGSAEKKATATMFFMTTASEDAFSAIIDRTEPNPDCCAGPQSHIMLSYFRMSPFDEDSPGADRSSRSAPELKQKLIKAMVQSPNKRWNEWLKHFTPESTVPPTLPKCTDGWRRFAEAYDSPDVDEISAVEISRFDAEGYLAGLKTEIGDDDIVQEQTQAFREAQSKGQKLKTTNYPKARYWGLISLLAGGEVLYVPVGITPNGRYIALASWEDGSTVNNVGERALVDEYNRNLAVAIRDSKSRNNYDRMVLYTGIHELFKKVEKPGDYRAPFGTGDTLLSRLGDFPGDGIPNLVILSEGWGPARTNGGKGLPIAENSENGFPVTGLYANESVRLEEVRKSVKDYMAANAAEVGERFKTVNNREPSDGDLEKVAANAFNRYQKISQANSANLVEDIEFTNPDSGKTETTASLATRIRKGEVKFCRHSIIQLYASNVNREFAVQFARISGCQIVFCTGNVTGKVTSKSADGSPEVTLTSSDGEFVKVTPLRKAADEVFDVYEERLGNSYELLK